MTDYLYSDSNGIKRVPGGEEDRQAMDAWLQRLHQETRMREQWRREALANLYRLWHDVSLRDDEPGFVLSNN